MIGAGDPLWLSALLAGLGGGAAPAAAGLRATATAAGPRMCIDGGAAALIAVRAPGPRSWEAHVLSGSDRAAGRQDWRGVRIAAGGGTIPLSRSMYRGRDGAVHAAGAAAAAAGGAASAERFDRWHRAIGGHGRIYAVGRDGGAVRIAWQLDRHAPVAAILAAVAGADGRDAAIASLAAVHGFDLALTAGPWSLSLDTSDDRAVRIGSTRWAWALEDAGKRNRLAAWIGGHGGDAAYAAALHDLIAGAAPARGPRTIGRAVEVDVAGGAVTGAIAYLGTALPPAAIVPAELGLSGRIQSWVG